MRSPIIGQLRTKPKSPKCETFSAKTLSSPYQRCHKEGGGSYIDFFGIDDSPFGGPKADMFQVNLREKFGAVFKIFDNPNEKSPAYSPPLSDILAFSVIKVASFSLFYNSPNILSLRRCEACPNCCTQVFTLDDAVRRLNFLRNNSFFDDQTACVPTIFASIEDRVAGG